jgi:uncharacterized protein YhjY with autotransporter beta-barrel domain
VTTDRTVTVAGTDRLEAEFKAQTFAARLEGGYRFATPWLGVTPYAALQGTSFHQPTYAENATTGSDTFALSYNSETTTNVRTELGARFDKSFLVGDGLLTLRSRLAWAHDSDTDRAVTAAFQALPGAAFTVNGAEPSADSALVSTGAELRLRGGLSLAARFEGEFADGSQTYAGKGTLRYAKSLVAATPQDQLVDSAKRKLIRGLTENQMALMERESANLEREFKMAEQSYGVDHLDLVLAKGFLATLLGNARVSRYLTQNHREILLEFQKIAELESSAA